MTTQIMGYSNLYDVHAAAYYLFRRLKSAKNIFLLTLIAMYLFF